MTHRERGLCALNQQAVDRPAVQFYYSPVGYYEHGEKLNTLFADYPGDFEPFRHIAIPKPAPQAIAPDGSYYEVMRDSWGVEWEYRVFGIMGHVLRPAIADISEYAHYQFPPWESIGEAERQQAATHRHSYPHMRGDGFSFLERLSALRGFEDALMDLMEDGSEINDFMDRLCDHYLHRIHALLDLGVDAIAFGDDYGTQSNLILSRELFCHCIKPRYQRLMEPIVKAGKRIHFHSCGKVDALFPDLRDIGVTSIWPQLPAYNMEELAYTCRDCGFGVAIHTDRANTMTHGSPADVREMVAREFELFHPERGGGWFYIEVDTGFPFANVEALVESIFKR